MRIIALFLFSTLAFCQGNLNVPGIPTFLSVGSIAVSAYQPIVFEIGNNGAIIPMTGTGLALGITEDAGTTGQLVRVVELGMVWCQFDAAPVVDQIAIFSGGACHNSGQSSSSNISRLLGVAGRVNLLMPSACSNCALVNFIGPGTTGTQSQTLTGLDNSSGFPVATLADGTTVTTTGTPIPAAQIQTDWTAVSGLGVVLHKPTLATVATSGLYTDLASKPTIPAAQVNSDWTASSGLTQILNKPTLATVATTGAYNDLGGKPTLPSTFPQCFNSSGTISNCKIWVGSATTNSSGVATFNLTAAGFSAAPTMCSFMATATASAANSLNITGVTGYTATQAQAFVTQPISLLGLGLLPVALVNGATVQAACTGT